MHHQKPGRIAPPTDAAVEAHEELGPDPSVGAPVLVISGASVQTFSLAGQTVGQAREQLRALLQIEPAATALVDGREARATQVLRTGSTLEFVRHAGEKG
jgi:hypothetical protein